MRCARALAGLAVGAVVAGCGSGSAASGPGGLKLFAEDCAICHSLNGRPTPRQQGGDLLGLHMSRTAMLQFVREMPVRHRLSSAEIQTVADYVRSIEARAP